MVELFRDADVGFTHLEKPLHDFEGSEIYPAAEAGGTWMHSPTFVAGELDWAGFDVVSHASNHALDYAYGGLYATWQALDDVDIPCAGTGADLADARSPVYVDTADGMVGFVSMTSSHTRWSRAGDARRDHPGRPGVNPLRYRQVVSSERMATIKDLAREFGYWIVPVDEGRWELTPPGLHNTVTELIVDDAGGSTRPHEADRRGNLRAIEDASRQADIVVAHCHAHEWKGGDDVRVPPEFITEFAREAVDAGADVFVCQGSHNLRGIELHDGQPIFYDLGDLFNQVIHTRLPADLYARHAHHLEVNEFEATPSEGREALLSAAFSNAEYPVEGYWSDPVVGFIVPVCEFESGELRRVEIRTGTHLGGSTSHAGLPRVASASDSRAILEHIRDLSRPFGTELEIGDDRGSLVL